MAPEAIASSRATPAVSGPNDGAQNTSAPRTGAATSTRGRRPWKRTRSAPRRRHKARVAALLHVPAAHVDDHAGVLVAQEAQGAQQQAEPLAPLRHRR